MSSKDIEAQWSGLYLLSYKIDITAVQIDIDITPLANDFAIRSERISGHRQNFQTNVVDQLLGSFIFALTCWRCSCYCHKLLLNFLLFFSFFGGHECQSSLYHSGRLGVSEFFDKRGRSNCTIYDISSYSPYLSGRDRMPHLV